MTGTRIDIFNALFAARENGERAALVTMVAKTGSSARSVGTHMAVLASDGHVGSFSAGCIDAAIAAEARDAIAAGQPRLVRFGHGSAYIDIRLPCGGGMDLLFLPEPPADQLRRAISFFEQRLPVTITMDEAGAMEVEPSDGIIKAGSTTPAFHVQHAPPLRLLIFGQGQESIALMRFAQVQGAAVELFSAADWPLVAASQAGVPATRLLSPSSMAPIDADRWTAIVLLFHDHEWEAEILSTALATPAFWIGAMGSRRAHEARREALVRRGITEAQAARIRGPIGLIPSARDPSTLALSALAEIVKTYQEMSE